MTAIAIFLLVLFALAFVAILANTIRSSKPDPRHQLHGPDAIEEAISRYDRRARYNAYLRFWDR